MTSGCPYSLVLHFPTCSLTLIYPLSVFSTQHFYAPVFPLPHFQSPLNTCILESTYKRTRVLSEQCLHLQQQTKQLTRAVQHIQNVTLANSLQLTHSTPTTLHVQLHLSATVCLTRLAGWWTSKLSNTFTTPTRAHGIFNTKQQNRSIKVGVFYLQR